MMLWYKNWLETRSRFVFTLTIIIVVYALLGTQLLLGSSKLDANNPPFLFITLVALIAFVSLAGTGVRTQAGHLTMTPNPKSTVFTLSLPVSRCRLLLIRSALGLLEGIVLSLICATLMWVILPERGTIFDFTTPLPATIVCGIWIYFSATFLSTFVNEGLYIWIYWIILGVYFLLAYKNWMPPFLNILEGMLSPIGTPVAIPWLPMAVYLAMSGILLLASIKVLESQEH